MDETRKQTSPKTGSCYFLSVSVQRCMRMPKTTESHSLSSRNPGVTHRGRQAARSPDLRTHPEGNRPHEGQSSIEAITVSFLLRVTQPLLLSYPLQPPPASTLHSSVPLGYRNVGSEKEIRAKLVAFRSLWINRFQPSLVAKRTPG